MCTLDQRNFKLSSFSFDKKRERERERFLYLPLNEELVVCGLREIEDCVKEDQEKIG